MVSKKNVIEEIQKLVQQIKEEYKEGVDFEFVAPDLINRVGGGFRVKIISPNLKKHCREHFLGFSSNVDFLIDYEIGDQEENDFYYRINDNSVGWDSLDCAKGGIYRHNHNKTVSKKCKECGKLTSYEEGQVVEWSGGNIPKVEIIAYFHPECAKKYFANKEQPNQSDNSQIKEKLLRNLDKLCLDPNGYLANNEYLKTDQAEEEYHKTLNIYSQKNRYLKIIIEGEEIDLEDWDNSCPEYQEVKRELIKKIKQEAKQNPSEWKIEEGTDRNNYNGWLIKNQKTGQRYWRLGLDYFNGGKRGNHWTEIEALINGSELPNKNLTKKDNKPKIDAELEKIKSIFQKHHIRKITYKEDQLFIEYDNQVNSVEKAVNGQEFKELTKYCQKYNEKEISKERFSEGNNTSPNSNPDKGNQKLAIGLVLGAGAVLLTGAVVYLVRKRKNKQT